MTRKRKNKLKNSSPPKDLAFSPKTQQDTLTLLAVIACFVLSGFAALLYQTAWLRQFSLTFGTSDIAIATVLAAYMGGLALGAMIAGRYASRVKNPVLVYGLLEMGIALSALAVPLLLLVARNLYVYVLGDQPSPPNWKYNWTANFLSLDWFCGACAANRLHGSYAAITNTPCGTE